MEAGTSVPAGSMDATSATRVHEFDHLQSGSSAYRTSGGTNRVTLSDTDSTLAREYATGK
jgi:hypothetical protein